METRWIQKKVLTFIDDMIRRKHLMIYFLFFRVHQYIFDVHAVEYAPYTFLVSGDGRTKLTIALPLYIDDTI